MSATYLSGSGRRWAVLAVMFVAQMLAIGLTAYSYGLFVIPLSEAFDLSRGVAAGGLMVFIVGSAVWSPLIGRALDKLPAKAVVVTGAILFTLGVQIVAWSHTLWLSMAGAFLFIGSGAVILGPLAANTLVARWFTEDRGRALGIISVSSSMGGLLVVPALAGLIEAFGWRTALALIGAVTGVVVSLLALIVLAEPPRPRAEGPGQAQAGRKPSDALTPRQILTTRDFWLIVIVVGSILATSQSLLASLISIAEQQGFDISEGAFLISTIAAVSIAGKLAFGWLADRIDLRILMIAVIALMTAFFGVLLLHPPYAYLLAGCALGGLAVGGGTMLWAAFVGMRFGPESFGSAMGLMIPFTMPLVFLGLGFIGAMYDRHGSYDPAFVGFLVYLPLLALLILPVRNPARADADVGAPAADRRPA